MKGQNHLAMLTRLRKCPILPLTSDILGRQYRQRMALHEIGFGLIGIAIRAVPVIPVEGISVHGAPKHLTARIRENFHAQATQDFGDGGLVHLAHAAHSTNGVRPFMMEWRS